MMRTYWQMTPSTYAEYVELLSEMADAENEGDTYAYQRAEDQFNRLPGCPAHKEGDYVVPVVTDPTTRVDLGNLTRH